MAIPTALDRRTALLGSLGATCAFAAVDKSVAANAPLQVHNVTGLYPVEVSRIDVPESTAEVATAVASWRGQVAVGGGRYSMGGQIGVKGGLHLDMRRMNRLVWVRPEARTVRVQAGMRWRDLQEVLDPLGLAVMIMQSYSNFTVGGSVSVNCHGRYVALGPVGHSVRALQLVMADGSVLEVGPNQRPELFAAAIGGYGAVGVVTEVELDVVPNVRIERRVKRVPLERYVDFFQQSVLSDSTAVLHNADLLPPDFDAPVSVTWHRVGDDKPLTETNRLVPRGASYALEQNAIFVMTEMIGGARLREKVVHPLLMRPAAVKWLNHEASLDAAELEPRTRAVSTYVLQEYFIPAGGFIAFAQGMTTLMRQRDVEALNISIRHSPADRVSALPWAKQEVFSFVLYYKQRTWSSARERVAQWTRELIDLALAHGGRYYLPYQLHATAAQFARAYPEVEALRRLKGAVDPQTKFSNELWGRYL
ncbi:FAD-binding oxidoreductase [Rubrivivax sp. RP6-9]|uniref:FAD-binding oxidoreductase n=1 Tax=Rubrivivax sp. RP6-9 TaxID=3415750 RepID=UPI003CC6DCCA